MLQSDIYHDYQVDELNFLCIPAIALLRRSFPQSFDYVIYHHPLLQQWVGAVDGNLTLGMIVIFAIIIFFIVCSIM